MDSNIAVITASSSSYHEKKEKGSPSLAAVLRVVLTLAFVGWLLIWVLLPTKTYKQDWIPTFNNKLNPTYLGTQGTNLLLFSFPVMFIAALGCVYLNLEKKSDNYNTKSVWDDRRLAFWKKPVLVKSPLGIVTAVELMFLAMFISLLVWSLANYLYVSFGHLHMGEKPVKLWQAKFRSVSLRLGYVGNICWAFLFFPVTRGSSILPLLGLTSESSIKYHIWLGHISMILFAGHSFGFIIFWAMTNQMSEMLDWSKTYVSNVAGEIAIVLAFAIWMTSLPRVRRKLFEVFFYTHHLYILYLFFYVLHVGIAYFCMILPSIFLFLIDRYLRFLQSRQHARLVSVRILPCEAIELNFSKSPGLSYTPTSIVFINVPSISKLQWHPFTITSNCNMESDKLSLVIKSEGRWSQNLYHKLSMASVDHLNVSIEGPYGPTSSSHLLRLMLLRHSGSTNDPAIDLSGVEWHELLVMVSGGSGITPFFSIIREIVFWSNSLNRPTPRVLLVCVFKNCSDLAMLDLLLPVSATPLDTSNVQLQIEAYVTREKEQPTTKTQKLLQTIWLKPNPLDRPVSVTLGPNSWLWLGAIISSSFVMFLLFLGILTRYYIYPIDQNTEEIFHFSFRALWDMFFICACIVLVSSVAVLWHKKQNAIEAGKQIQKIDVQTPTTSPGSWFFNGDRELESLPHDQSSLFVQATRVHLGERPDLKKILFDRKESDVGVLVCGPRKMRHEVARICSAGLVDNLHFESISFNW